MHNLLNTAQWIAIDLQQEFKQLVFSALMILL